MRYYSKEIKSKKDYRKGSWTCKASAKGVELSDDDNPYPEILKLMTCVSEKTQLSLYTLLYKCNRFGFNRVEKYTGFKSQESELLLSNCYHFTTEDDNGCSYMYSCAPIDLNLTSLHVFNYYHAVIFLGNESKYQDVVRKIPELKCIEKIENYLIQSGAIIIESEDLFDMGYYIWFISTKEKLQSLIDQM